MLRRSANWYKNSAFWSSLLSTTEVCQCRPTLPPTLGWWSETDIPPAQGNRHLAGLWRRWRLAVCSADSKRVCARSGRPGHLRKHGTNLDGLADRRLCPRLPAPGSWGSVIPVGPRYHLSLSRRRDGSGNCFRRDGRGDGPGWDVGFFRSCRVAHRRSRGSCQSTQYQPG